MTTADRTVHFDGVGAGYRGEGCIVCGGPLSQGEVKWFCYTSPDCALYQVPVPRVRRHDPRPENPKKLVKRWEDQHAKVLKDHKERLSKEIPTAIVCSSCERAADDLALVEGADGVVRGHCAPKTGCRAYEAAL